MRLAELLDGAAGSDTEITDLAHDTRDVRPGALFFCVPGFSRDGHELASQAVAAGAAALVVERPLRLGVPEVVVADARAAMAPAAARFFGRPTTRLPVVGITGTNGKTTTAYLLRGLLEASGRQTGLLGTVATFAGGVERPSERTTPEAITLQRTFAEMLAGGDAACVMEVSSHALALHRVDAIDWRAVAFLNLTHDHLDFHATMEDYLAAKRLLLDAAGDETVVVVNVDDPYGRRLAGLYARCVTIGFGEDAAIRAVSVRQQRGGSSFEVDGRRFAVSLRGRFNVLNALAAIALARALGLEDDEIAAALPDVAPAPGRFQAVDEGQRFAVVVDYAHAPEALALALDAAREIARGRVLCVFGCGGDRDRSKRPLMGAAAAAGADLAIVTSDNPRSEDPEAIIAEVVAGMNGAVAREIVVDRRAAIARAIALAGPDDVVLVAGKGHEQGQEVAGAVLEFDDVEVSREALRARLDA